MAANAPDNKPISVVIAGRPYPIRVADSEEEGLRALVKEINDRFNDFQIRYRDRDKQDCLVMTLLTYASELRSARDQADSGADSELSKRLAKLNDLVEGML
ncbi:cell division protein ZapA [Neolewinella xylanilytica]|uniref:Cell division protein ZapA n=1 Tax=Neolewinella xylanilytica TaxID=1514080 RepID=A0A2S6I1S1_9BACT|nr:cell division protein ZapA [Neolewinella xylanilytica]PPK85093.1 cell division protein ZapA [Neolewinella xylanilytica]